MGTGFGAKNKPCVGPSGAREQDWTHSAHRTSGGMCWCCCSVNPPGLVQSQPHCPHLELTVFILFERGCTWN